MGAPFESCVHHVSAASVQDYVRHAVSAVYTAIVSSKMNAENFQSHRMYVMVAV